MNAVECTHCRVLMTSWSVPGSTVRYWQCPFCGRTFSSLYGEVFTRGAGARRVEPPAGPTPSDGAPQASRDEIAWAQLKLRASRWFARLEREDRSAPESRSAAVAATPRTAAVRR